MQDSESRKFDMLMRVDNYCLNEHTADFPAGTLASDLAQALRALVTELHTHIGAQATARRLAQASTDRKERARQTLRATLELINATARGMEPMFPGTAAQFRLPARKDDALAAAARAFNTNATPLRTEFIRRELPEDFLAQLQRQLDDFEHIRIEQATHADSQVAATSAMRAQISQGQTLVRQLDPIVRNKYHTDPALLAAWRSASHVERAPRHKPEAEQTKTDAGKPPQP